MDVLEAIRTRQSIGKVRPDPVPRELIERMLSAGVQAPNHYQVRPWRFVVLTGDARVRLGDVMAASLHKQDASANTESLARERAKPLRAPVLIAVGVDKPGIPKVVEIENVCAAAAAIQNMLLAAHALGLAAMWRTGTAAYDADVKTFLGFAPDQHVIGFIYVGYPATPPPPQRPSHHDRTVWMD
ncbi:MAG TPA: nitroreductase [Anaerolineae bacterium]